MKHLLVAAILASLTACSPYLYQSEIEAFGTATTALSAVATTQHEWEIAERTRQLEHQLRKLHETSRSNRVPLLLPAPEITGGCGAETIPPNGCRLALRIPNIGTRPTEPTPEAYSTELCPETDGNIARYCLTDFVSPTTSYDHVGPYVTALSAYANSLVLVTNATDRASFVKASGALPTSVGNLAKIGGPSAEANDREALANSIGNLFVLGLRVRLDQRRYAALRAAVSSANPHFAVCDGVPDCQEGAFGLIHEFFEKGRENQLGFEGDLLEDAIDEAAQTIRRPNLSANQYVQAVLAIDQRILTYRNHLAAPSPAEAYDQMARAHGALNTAIQSEDGQMVQAANALSEFINATNSLRTAVEAFSPEEQPANGQ